MPHLKNCLIIGAGISGLMAATALQNAGMMVTIIDKGRGVGGRMASRRIGTATFDHGAQFFTVRSPGFQHFVDQWLARGHVKIWSHGFKPEAQQAGHPRFCSVPGMTAVPKALAQDLNVLLQTQIKCITRQNQTWIIEDQDHQLYQADALVLTPPVPQSLALLDSGDFELPEEARKKLAAIEYDRCIAMLVKGENPGHVPAPGAIRFDQGPIQWIADNHQKGISQTYGFTIHTSPAFSLDNWETEPNVIASELLKLTRPWTGQSGTVEWQIHKWRYSQPKSQIESPCMAIDTHPPLIFAGDAFGGARVEGAALSGLAAADYILSEHKI